MIKNPEEINEVLINAKETINALRDTIKTQKEVIAKLEQRLEAGQQETLVMRIREKCDNEIKWVKDSLDEHAELGNYTKADEHYLPGYRKAFEEILELIKDV